MSVDNGVFFLIYGRTCAVFTRGWEMGRCHTSEIGPDK